jgi:alcohol dehydrogenase
VAVRLAGICRTDLELAAGYKGFQGLLGHEFVGEVLSCSDPARVGQRVVGEINVACQRCAWCLAGGDDRHCPHRRALGIRDLNGAFAERLSLPLINLHSVPNSVPDRAAVFCEPLAAALAVLEAYPFEPGTEVLLCGDGNLGALLAQVLHRRCRLTWLGRHPDKLERWRQRGYRTTLTIDCQYPVIVEATGNPAALAEAQVWLEPRGTLVLKSTTAAERLLDLNLLVVSEQRVVGSRCGRFGPALKALEAKTVEVQELILASYPLDNALEGFAAAGRRGAGKILLEVG